MWMGVQAGKVEGLVVEVEVDEVEKTTGFSRLGRGRGWWGSDGMSRGWIAGGMRGEGGLGVGWRLIV